MKRTQCYQFDPVYKDGKLSDLNLCCRVMTKSGYVYEEYLLSTLIPADVTIPILTEVLNSFQIDNNVE